MNFGASIQRASAPVWIDTPVGCVVSINDHVLSPDGVGLCQRRRWPSLRPADQRAAARAEARLQRPCNALSHYCTASPSTGNAGLCRVEGDAGRAPHQHLHPTAGGPIRGRPTSPIPMMVRSMRPTAMIYFNSSATRPSRAMRSAIACGPTAPVSSTDLATSVTTGSAIFRPMVAPSSTSATAPRAAIRRTKRSFCLRVMQPDGSGQRDRLSSPAARGRPTSTVGPPTNRFACRLSAGATPGIPVLAETMQRPPALGHFQPQVADLDVHRVLAASSAFRVRLTQADGRTWIVYLRITDELYIELLPVGVGPRRRPAGGGAQSPLPHDAGYRR